jgi:hypothetical protein
MISSRRVAVAGLDAAEPSRLLASLLAAEDDETLSGPQLLAAAAGWERLVSMAHAGQARVLRRLEAAVAARTSATPPPPGGDVDAGQQTSEEVALALRVSPRAADARLDLAERLELLPTTLTVLSAGQVTLAHARVIVDALTGLDVDVPEVVRDRLDVLLATAAAEQHLTPGQLRAKARRLLLVMDPHGCVQRRQKAVRGRDVSCRADEHGMAWLSAYLPAPAALACVAALDAHAHGSQEIDPDDTRGLGARRADALVNLVLTGTPDGNPPADAHTPAAVTVHLNVTVPLTALAGASEDPGDLAGHGPLDASTIRALADTPGTLIRRLLTDPRDGRLVEAGTRTYRPSVTLDRFVRLRDVTCRWPGCQRPSHACDLDHTVPWPTGDTTAHNLLALCRRHHRLKTHAGFGLQHDPGTGTVQITTPLQQTYSSKRRE